MPGLHPLQNAAPRHQIPNEAPRFFSPFFEQPAKPLPVSIWQPPTVEQPRRSKAPTHRPRSPPQIPTAGTWSRRSSHDEKPQPTGLFQPKKKSLDEIMWLGSVAGFPLPELSHPVEQRSLRSKLIRKPEEIPSQASSATGPRATEANRRKEEEARAKEKRLEEWATKKKSHGSDKNGRHGGMPMIIPIPQPIESRLRPRKQLYTPLPQPEEAARTSNRPNAIHRPHIPYQDSSYAPNKPFFPPQPIETIKRSNRPRTPLRRVGSGEEESMWMGNLQPIETTKRSNRRSPLNKMQSVDEQDGEKASDKDSTKSRPADSAVSVPLPQPIESTRRSNRPVDKKEVLPEPIETTKRSNRPVKELLPEPFESSHRSNKPAEKKVALLPQPIESTRRSNRPSINTILPEPIETTRRSNRPTTTATKNEVLPVPIESTKRSTRPASVQEGDPSTSTPTTPTTSFFSPEILPQPVETTRRSHRPINVRPLIPQVIESSMRSSLTRVPHRELNLELPQPVSVSRWTSRAPGLRRDPNSPGQHALHGLYFSHSFSRNERNRRKQPKFPGPAADHVWHLEEPIDSTPTSPVVSPLHSPSASKCPSLCSSPTSSATSSAWDVPVKAMRIQCRRESLEGGFSDCVLVLGRTLEELKEPDERAKEGFEYPFPITEDANAGDASNIDGSTRDRVGQGIRSESSETIRPKLRALQTEPAIKLVDDDDQPRQSNADDEDDDYEYPICHSPKFEAFKKHAPLPDLPPLDKQPEDGSHDRKLQLCIPPNGPKMWKPPGRAVIASNSSISVQSTPPTSVDSSTSSSRIVASHTRGGGGHSGVGGNNGVPLSVPPRMWHRPAGPSPGYTVASLPPAKRREITAKEVTPSFVDEVYRYLSLQFDNVAGKFDAELAAYTDLTITAVRRDRKAALAMYCERWVRENPDFEAGEARKAGLW